MSSSASDSGKDKVAPIASIAFERFQVQRIHLQQEPIGVGEQPSFNVEFSPSGRLSRSQGRFELKLYVTVSSVPENCLKAEIDALSYFTFDPKLESNDLLNLLKHNTLGLTFPYIRAYLSAITALSGLTTVTMPTFNLTSLSEVLSRNTNEVDAL